MINRLAALKHGGGIKTALAYFGGWSDTIDSMDLTDSFGYGSRIRLALSDMNFN